MDKKAFDMEYQEITLHCGATLGNIKVTDFDFADDVAILCESLEFLVVALDAFSDEPKSLGLEVSWTKTKIQDFGDLLGEPVLILPILLYGSETWTLSCTLEFRLDAFCNRSLRRIMVYCWRDYVSNQRLHRVTGIVPVTCTIRDHQLRLYDNLARFPQDNPAHQVISVRDNPGWRRPVVRPRKSWLGLIDQTCREELEMGRVPA
ncbi:uncharacterized protein [Penaeus vannamei]|uniref:uncharacterized protein n=1 Tax=Penaeus vannamei TaxID=6689 RepID=UPI00387F96E8